MDGTSVGKNIDNRQLFVKNINNIVKYSTLNLKMLCDVAIISNRCKNIIYLTRRKEMVFEKIKELIVEQLDVEESQVTMDTDFMKDLEADSLDAVEIILGVEEEYGIEIPDEVAENFTKVSDIVKYVEANK